MKELRELLLAYLDERLLQIVVSGPRGEAQASRLRVRPVQIKGRLLFQVTRTVGPQELHENYDKETLIDRLQEWILDYRQLQLEHSCAAGTVLVSKKGKLTVKVKKKEKPELMRPVSLAHNRKKQYILEPGEPVEFLVDLGVMTKEGRIVQAKYDKFRQVNRFLEFIQDVLPQLPRNRELTIIDFGCGKSYLTFAMYHYLRVQQGLDVRMIGLDLKADVIENCNRLAKKYGYEKLQFLEGDIAGYQGVDQVDMVVTLHACDTATDYALAKAVAWKAGVILSVPCCQHELNRQISNDTLEPVLSYGILKERMAALVTDGLRAQLLEGQGYRTQILEFVDMEHTPKNLLIRAVRTGKNKDNRDKLRACMDALHVKPTLEQLLAAGAEAQPGAAADIRESEAEERKERKAAAASKACSDKQPGSERGDCL